MAGAPKYKVFTDRQKYIASCKEIQDAAYLAQSYGEGASVRLGHSKKDIVLLIDSDHDSKSIDDLICAAPDLLAALQRFYDYMAFCSDNSEAEDDLVEMAREAIAKAKGGAQ